MAHRNRTDLSKAGDFILQVNRSTGEAGPKQVAGHLPVAFTTNLMRHLTTKHRALTMNFHGDLSMKNVVEWESNLKTMIFTNKNGGIKIKEVLLCMIGIHGDVP